MLIGTMGAEPEFKILNNGQMAVATVSIATNESYKDQQGNTQERTEWHRLVFWNKLADVVHQYLHKGSQIYVEGKIRTRSYDDQNSQKKYVTEIQVTEMLMLGGKQEPQQNSPAPQPQPQQPQGQQWQPQQPQQRWQPAQQNYQQGQQWQPQQRGNYQPHQKTTAQQPQPQPMPAPDAVSDDYNDPLPF